MRTVINIKAEKQVKEKAQKLAKELGFSLSAVINAYLKNLIRNKEVYFSIVPKMTTDLENLLSGVEYDIKRNQNLSPAFSSAKDIKKHLNSL